MIKSTKMEMTMTLEDIICLSFIQIARAKRLAGNSPPVRTLVMAKVRREQRSMVEHQVLDDAVMTRWQTDRELPMPEALIRLSPAESANLDSNAGL